jgi:hypothetical protein
MSLDYKTTGYCYCFWLAALHKSEAYKHLMNNEDRENMKWLKVFNKYDLYSKSKVRVNVEEVKPYYLSLTNKVVCIYFKMCFQILYSKLWSMPASLIGVYYIICSIFRPS